MLDNPYYKLYLNDIFKLAQTLVIKVSSVAESINQLIRLKYGEDSVDNYSPHTWKYYMNLAGIYHSTDTIMKVRSLDTLEEIVFSRQNLLEHPSTKDAYQYGSRYCKQLMQKYPTQERLILGILYPCDINKAIEAEDGEIINYPKNLVEEQEITLIKELSFFIKQYMSRWDVDAFNINNRSYKLANLSILYSLLVPKILNLRMLRCRTDEAHSFHIRMYLASHGRLDRYMDYMTLKQQLFLYRNIKYINHNAGQTTIFKWLIERLLTDRKIPISEFSVRHQDTFNENYQPNYLFRKKPINTQFNVPEKDYFTYDEIIKKEIQTATYNRDYYDNNYDKIDQKARNALSSVTQTKDLESSMVDYTDSHAYKFYNIIIHHWGYMTKLGLYKGVVVNHKNPLNGEIYSLTCEDAFIYYVYAVYLSFGIKLKTIPGWLCERVVRPQLPTVSELESYVDKNALPYTELPAYLHTKQPRLRKCNNRLRFYQLCNDIFNNMIHQDGIVSNHERIMDRGYAKNLIDLFHQDIYIKHDEYGKDYETWLLEKAMPLDEYTPKEGLQLAKNLLEGSTGYKTDDTKLLKNIQRAMIAVMLQLSSYSIQIIREINESEVDPLSWSAARIETSGTKQKTDQYIYTPISHETTGKLYRTDKVNPKVIVSDKLNLNYSTLIDPQICINTESRSKQHPTYINVKLHMVTTSNIDTRELFRSLPYEVKMEFLKDSMEIEQVSDLVSLNDVILLKGNQ